MKYFFIVITFIFLTFYCNAQVIDTLIKINGFQLHFNYIKGKGIPIIFEAGNGDDASVWKDLIKQIHEITKAPIITYDRAGLGKSQIDTNNISFHQEVKNLKIVLAKLGYNDKYFLVAHSFGGIYASEFSNLSKGKIKGAVFIDVATPCQLNIEVAKRIKNSISDENWMLLKQYKTGLYYVLKNFPNIINYMQNRYISSKIPMTLIVADNYIPTEEIGETESDMTKWKICLKNLGNLPNHKYVTTKNTDHKVWEKDPNSVIDEIVKLYNKVKNH